MNQQESEVLQKLRNKLQDSFLAMTDLEAQIGKVTDPNQKAALTVSMAAAMSEMSDFGDLIEELSNIPVTVTDEVKGLIDGIAKKAE